MDSLFKKNLSTQETSNKISNKAYPKLKKKFWLEFDLKEKCEKNKIKNKTYIVTLLLQLSLAVLCLLWAENGDRHSVLSALPLQYLLEF